MPFCSFKHALLYCLSKFSYSKCPFRKGHLNKGILSRDIGGHFLKGKRAFPPNRQKPNITFVVFDLRVLKQESRLSRPVSE